MEARSCQIKQQQHAMALGLDSTCQVTGKSCCKTEEMCIRLTLLNQFRDFPFNLTSNEYRTKQPYVIIVGTTICKEYKQL